jgi:hypothetical protein
MTYVTLYHDPFARGSRVREVVPTGRVCSWCGRVRTRAGKNVNALFRYGWHADDGLPPVWEASIFCSKECRDNYYW